MLEWPSQSPDLNPIENLWSDLKIAVHKRKPSNVKMLEQFCKEEWAKIPVVRCGKLIETYPKQLGAVIATKGDSTNEMMQILKQSMSISGCEATKNP